MGNFLRAIIAIDSIHSRPTPAAQNEILRKRELYGKVFGVEIPAWIIFHAMLGYILLGSGLAAIAVRLPIPFMRKSRYLHPYFGAGWVLGCVYMPLTAIWCVYNHPDWDAVAFFIFSMYITITIGYILIRIFIAKKKILQLGHDTDTALPKRDRVYKWAHGTFMIYSFVMLLGAGVSFPLRALDDYKDPK